jgi:hypothetical protein
VRDLGSSPGAFPDAAKRLQRLEHLVNVRHGFYNAGAPCRVVEDRLLLPQGHGAGLRGD